ncbi:hypothetical protein JCM11491_001516, partial [Sporobolomyces phaffii]
MKPPSIPPRPPSYPLSTAPPSPAPPPLRPPTAPPAVPPRPESIQTTVATGYEAPCAVELKIAKPLASPDTNAFARTTNGQAKQEFIWDTGASIHLTDRLDLLHDYEALPPHRHVRIGGVWNGSGQAIGRGVLKGDFHLDDGSVSMVDIHHVYYAPKIGHNLISGLQLIAQGFSTTNNRSKVDLLAPGGALVAQFIVDLARGSIFIPARWTPAPPSPAVTPLPVRPAVDLTTWHERLGHSGERRLALMKDERVSSGMDVKP